MMEYYDQYLARIEENSSPELLDKLRREAIQSLEDDPPEQALTLTGQMVGALLVVAHQQEPPKPSVIETVNSITAMIADYVGHLGWRWWAVKGKTGWIYSKSPVGS